MIARTGFMIDLDGTVYKGNVPIPGASEFINELITRDIPFVFLTNNSSRDREHYLRKLNGMGFDVKMKNILSSTTAAIRFLNDNFHEKKVYAMGTEQFLGELKKGGIILTESDPDIVLLAFDRTITYDKINKAYHFLNGGAKFIATHPDDLCPTEDGYDIDIGPFIRLFESMTGKTATIIGKPNGIMVKMAAAEMGLDPKDLWMIGDRLYTDMEMARSCGIRSVLVLSGETSVEDLKESDIRPTLVKDTIFDVLPELDGILKK